MLAISNNGNSTLTVTGITGPSGYTASWTSGTIAAGANQDVTVRFTPIAETSYNGTVTVNADHTSGTNTITISGTGSAPPGPRTSFGAGQYLVNSDIVAARYFSAPRDGCYWERQSGLGGTLNEIIANEFIGYNAGQWIVDILRSDVGFETDVDCGLWNQSQRRGLQADIAPGMWIVGSQVAAGRYRTNAQAGCYWERMRHFQGTLSGIIANDFISSPGQAIVDIRSSDAGFQAEDSCGTWTRVSTLGPVVDDAARMQSFAEIESNWERNRQRKAGRR